MKTILVRAHCAKIQQEAIACNNNVAAMYRDARDPKKRAELGALLKSLRNAVSGMTIYLDANRSK